MPAVKTKTVFDRIAHLHPCSDAAEWARGYTSPVKAWRECQRGGWAKTINEFDQHTNTPEWLEGYNERFAEFEKVYDIIAAIAEATDLR